MKNDGRPSLDLGRYRHIMVLTGAGVSVASGLRPFRGPDGLWNDQELVRLSDIGTFREEPLAVWRFWSEVRQRALAAEPNPAHTALADFERRLGDAGWVTVVTQNVDGLHQRAGSARVVEYHGSVLRTRCSSPACDLEPYEDRESYVDEVPRCPRCGRPLRPDIVFFGEAIPPAASSAAQRAVFACDLFVAAGTSGTVYPAAGFADAAKLRGVPTVLINLEPLESRGPYSEVILGKAEEAVPDFFGVSAP